MAASEDPSIRAWREGLTTETQRLESRFQRAINRWNFWYYTCMYGSIVLSTLAALVLKLEVVTGAWQKDVAAGLAALSAIVGTAMVSGNFERRWRTARRARASVQQLRLAMMNPRANLAELTKELEDCVSRYTDGVLGDQDGIPRGGGSTTKSTEAQQSRPEDEADMP